MTLISAITSNQQSIYAALELSKNSWLLAIQVSGRDNPSLHPIKGGDAEGLMAKLDAARDRVASLARGKVIKLKWKSTNHEVVDLPQSPKTQR